MSDSIIRSLGAGSGIDTNNLVSSLVEAERLPKDERLNSREEKLEAQISAYGTLKSSLSELQGVLTPLADNDTFNARSVAFPDTDVITPNSVEAGAQTGTYNIEVEKVAQSHSIAINQNPAAGDNGFDDKDAALNQSGTLTIDFVTWSYTGGNPDPNPELNDERAALNITVEATDSLQSIADKINAEESDIQASVLQVDGQYQLLLTAPPGEGNALRINSDDATTGDDEGLSVFEFNSNEYSQVTETQQAQDAELRVNGLLVKRESNEISDVIDGFNFSLNKAEPGSSFTFTVSADTDIAEQAVRDFVEAYNLFYETAQNLTGYTTNEENETVRGDLATDGSAKAVISQIRSSIGAAVPGVDDAFSSLTHIGIRTELDGTLSIDEDDLRDAFDNDFSLVESLFASDTSSASETVKVTVGSYSSNTVPGDYEVVITTDPVKGAIETNAINGAALVNFDSVNDLFTTDLDTDAGDYSFSITVDDTLSNEITLTGNFGTTEELRAQLQVLVNGDQNLKDAGVAVDVSYNTATDSFEFTSRRYGSKTNVSFSGTTADMQNLGFADSGLTETAGQDVVGTINGVAGFGSGSVLLPKIDSDGYGLNFRVSPGAVAATAAEGGSIGINFSRGFAGQLSNLIDDLLANDGAIDSREDSINEQLGEIEVDRKDLDRKMEKYEERLFSQFLAMERIIASLNSTSDQLDGILERLPFTYTGGN